jgi:hypothetical protein
MAARRPLTLWTATALAAVPVLLLVLPWWSASPPVVLAGRAPAWPGQADSWAGWELVGPLRATLLAGLLVAAGALLAVARPRGARVLLVVTGAAAAVAGVEVLLGWGAGMPAAAAVVMGSGAAVLAAAGTPAVLAVALLAAGVPLLPGGPAVPTGAQAGPFERLARLDAAELRSGTAGLPLLSGKATVAVVEGRAGVATTDGLAVVDDRGRTQVLARTPEGPRDRPAIIGAARGRVVRWSAADEVTITALDAADPVAVTVMGVSAVSRLGAGGVLWVRATADPPGATRLLDLAERDGVQEPDATFLPVGTIHPPADSAPVDVATLLPLDDGAVRIIRQEAGHRLERLTSGPAADTEVTVLAGGLDDGCGLTSSGPASFLPQVGPLVAGADGELWFTTGDGDAARLVRLDADGTLRAVAAKLPGHVDGLAVQPVGAVVLAVHGPDGPGLWRLAEPAAALAELPPPPPGCGAAMHLAPPVDLVPVARTRRDASAVPLGADGRWAAGGSGPAGDVTLVAPNGTRTPLGVRADGAARVVPDGAGGVWWWEPGAGLVHAARSGAQRRHAVGVPGEGRALVPDLGGRPPLLATDAGAFRVGSGGGPPVRVAAGPIGGGVVRADGRGWLVADGRLLALDGDRVLGPVIDAGERSSASTPVAAQLARGVAPLALALPRAAVGLDPSGRALVVADDVVLAVADDGAVSVVAQDRRLVDLPVFAAEGGLVGTGRGELLRVDLP